jgi:hypothetical protein
VSYEGETITVILRMTAELGGLVLVGKLVREDATVSARHVVIELSPADIASLRRRLNRG